MCSMVETSLEFESRTAVLEGIGNEASSEDWGNRVDDAAAALIVKQRCMSESARARLADAVKSHGTKWRREHD